VVARVPGRRATFVRQVELALDFGSPRTTLTTGAIGQTPIPIDDLDGTGSTQVSALITFTDQDGVPRTYQLDALMRNGPADQSRIGCDLLQDWLTVVHPAEGLLVVEPQDPSEWT
jgi:hypothetical protein